MNVSPPLPAFFLSLAFLSFGVTPTTAEVSRVGALGRIEPRSEVLDIDAAGPDRVARLLVEEGQAVKRGQELVHLDRHGVSVAERDAIAARLEEARRRLVAAQQVGEAKTELARLALRSVEELTPTRIAAQAAAIRSLEAERENARRESRRAQRLLGTDTMPEEIAQRRDLVAVSLSERLASERLVLKEMKADHQLSLATAQAELVAAEASLAEEVASIPTESLEAELALAEAQLELTLIRAPIDGRVLNVFTWPGERTGVEPILQLGDTSEMHVVAEVYETDVQHLRLGQAASIQSAALPTELTGEVVFIGLMIHKNDVLEVDPAAEADARVVEVRIRLTDASAVAGLTNLQVDVVIDVAGGR
ncbi:MAG: efflux RND transporter periplasmic adaptor subunit [Acidobacteriota bacterium]